MWLEGSQVGLVKILIADPVCVLLLEHGHLHLYLVCVRLDFLVFVEHVLLSECLDLALGLELSVSGAMDGLIIATDSQAYFGFGDVAAGCFGLFHCLVNTSLFPLAQSVQVLSLLLFDEFTVKLLQKSGHEDYLVTILENFNNWVALKLQVPQSQTSHQDWSNLIW